LEAAAAAPRRDGNKKLTAANASAGVAAPPWTSLIGTKKTCLRTSLVEKLLDFTSYEEVKIYH